MPELPEVETITRSLRTGNQDRQPIVGRTLVAVHLLWGRTLAEPSPEILQTRLPGQTITGVERRGKFLILNLSVDFLLIHLRMSGDIRVEPAFDSAGNPLSPAPHDRLLLDFTDGYRLAFNDTRKFGRVWLVSHPESVVGLLGPEPFDPHFTAFELYQRLQKSRRQIKPLLLDQTFLAGLGNIYTDEALHQAGIHPLQSSESISPEQAGKLWTAIRTVLSEGIRRNGASIDWVYRGGDFQNHFQVYDREGKACPTCGSEIIKIAVGQRGTHFCPTCQPKR